MFILSEDDVFSRMLLRVLENAGYSEITVSKQRKSFVDYAIVDLEFPFLPVLGPHCLTFSKKAGKCADLLRPFTEEALLELVHHRMATTNESRASSLPTGVSPTVSPNISLELKENGLQTPNGTIFLSPKERAVYTLLAEHRGKCVSRKEINEKIFFGSEGNNAEVYINYLRKKLSGIQEIRTVWGKGYMIP